MKHTCTSNFGKRERDTQKDTYGIDVLIKQYMPKMSLGQLHACHGWSNWSS